MSWLRPQKRSARVSLPLGPSKAYSFSTLTQGRLRRSRFNWSRKRLNFFSLASKLLRAVSHLSRDTTLCSSVPFLVFSLAIVVFELRLTRAGRCLCERLTFARFQVLFETPFEEMVPALFANVETVEFPMEALVLEAHNGGGRRG